MQRSVHSVKRRKVRRCAQTACLADLMANKFAIRGGKRKLVLGAGSGGWAQPTDDAALVQGLPTIQLYGMKAIFNGMRSMGWRFNAPPVPAFRPCR